MISELAGFTLRAGGYLKQIPIPPLFFFFFRKKSVGFFHIKQNNYRSQYLFLILFKLTGFPQDETIVRTVSRFCCNSPLIPKTCKMSISSFVLL